MQAKKCHEAIYKTRIMLVDDDRLVLATLNQGLNHLGYEVEAFGDAKEALSRYEACPPDLAILDVRMPEMTGPELAQTMLGIHFRPILMLSAYDDQPMVQDTIKLGVSGYLVKPIEPNQLAPSIEAAITRFSEVDALVRNNENIREGLEKNRLISTAVGIFMERGSLSRDAAFQRLRNYARSQRRPLVEIAAIVVEQATHVNCIINHVSDSD